MNVVVRDARVEDAAAILAVLNPIITSGAPVAFDAPLTEDAERSYISAFPERGVFHVAVHTDEGRIVGFQSMEPFAAYTHAFDHVGVVGTYVAAECRRQGVATLLFAETLRAAAAKGYEKLFTYIRDDNPEALAAYASQGFEVIGRAKRHLKERGRYVDELMVERFL